MKIAIMIALGIGLLLVLRKLFQSKDKDNKPTGAPIDLSNLKISDARVGDLIVIPGASASYDDVELKIDRKHRYEWGSTKWHELSGRNSDGRYSISVEDEDISLTLPNSTLRLDQLNLTEDDLVRFDEEQSAKNKVHFEGVDYHYTTSRELQFFENSAHDSEGFYSWEFEADNGKLSLSIEKWEGEAFEACVNTTIPFDDIKVFRK